MRNNTTLQKLNSTREQYHIKQVHYLTTTPYPTLFPPPPKKNLLLCQLEASIKVAIIIQILCLCIEEVQIGFERRQMRDDFLLHSAVFVELRLVQESYESHLTLVAHL